MQGGRERPLALMRQAARKLFTLKLLAYPGNSPFCFLGFQEP